MTTLSYPSNEFPVFPSLSIDVPDDWEALIVDNTVLAAGAPHEERTFKPNICVSVDRHPGSRTIEDAAAATAGALEAAEDYTEIGREFREVLGAPGFRIEGSFIMQDVGTLFQASHIAIIQHAGSYDIVHAIATCSASQAKDLVPTMREALDSLRKTN
ncbi:MAG: hypothetical protein GX862_05845 [Leucobacter sp.]|nr:hypothetical protein [Leucobacter sp.]